MGKAENSGIWENIQKSVQETERLMGQKKYNLSMIKARQTVEYMVKLRCDKAGIVEGAPDAMIHELYNGGFIDKSTAEHYLQILELGNKATKDGDNSAYNANQAYHVLSQEIYSFVDADKTAKRSRTSAQQAANRSRKRTAAPSSAGANPSNAPKSAKSVKSTKSSRAAAGFSTQDLLKLFIPIALVIILIFLIKVLSPKKEPTNEATTPPVSVEQQVTTEAAEEVVETEAAEPVAVTYKTTTTLNVRSGPSTETDRIGKLDPDKTVEFVRDHDDFWAVILYNGQEAYVAKEYLTTVTE